MTFTSGENIFHEKITKISEFLIETFKQEKKFKRWFSVVQDTQIRFLLDLPLIKIQI